MSVPVGMEYTATLNIAVPQLVRCLHCDTEFIYMMKRSAQGSATSLLFIGMDSARSAAEDRARAKVEAELQNPEACDPVPCPKCFKYQSYMCGQVARTKYKDHGCFAYVVVGLGTALMIGAGVLAYLLPDAERALTYVVLSGLLVLLAGCALAIRTMRLVAQYAPNERDLYNRKVIAGAWAKSLEEFDTNQARGLRDEYEKYTQTLARKQNRRQERNSPGAKQSRTSPAKRDDDKLIVTWWVVPSMFVNGGSITIPISESVQVVVEVPDTARPGDVFDLKHCPDDVIPFQVRVLPIYAHRDEQRLEYPQ
jgi:hypothetical protein